MVLEEEYESIPWDWVSDQVAEYGSSGGQRANTLRDTGMPIVIFTTPGSEGGKIRKTPVMRVEYDGEYALVASMGGVPQIQLGTTTSGEHCHMGAMSRGHQAMFDWLETTLAST